MLHRHLFVIVTLSSLATIGRGQTLDAVLVADTGSGEIVDLTSPPGDSSRLFVVDRDGFIRIIEGGLVLDPPFLDVSSLTLGINEMGLLGMAFHPEYSTNGKFYVNYTTVNEPPYIDGSDTVIAEYTVQGDPHTSNHADPSSAVIIRTIVQPYARHQGGCIRFGPDGMLYVGMGDGGGGGGNDPQNRAQDPLDLLGKILRLDVDNPPTYIPADNPGVGEPGRADELWSMGLRNPWRFSFDQVTGDLYIGDVGQSFPTGREEIHFSPAEASGLNAGRAVNYGWRCLNGSDCSGNECSIECPSPVFQLPVHEYMTGLDGAAAIAGGFVYRGDNLPALQGTYFFSDAATKGRIWSFRLVDGAVTEFTDRSIELGAGLGRIAGMGQDSSGEIYLLDFGGGPPAGMGEGGQIYRIQEPCPAPTNYCSAIANSSGQPAEIGYAGSNSLFANDLAFVLSNLPTGEEHTGIIAYSPDQDQLPLGNGNLCLGTTTLGYIVRGDDYTAGDLGAAVVPYDSADPPIPSAQVTVGSTWHYQAWFRDFVDAGFNFTNGLSITWCP